MRFRSDSSSSLKQQVQQLTQQHHSSSSSSGMTIASVSTSSTSSITFASSSSRHKRSNSSSSIATIVPSPASELPTLSVSPEQMTFLKEKGYVVLPRVVPRDLIDNTLRVINCRIGEGVNDKEAENFKNGLCFPELMDKQCITDLYHKSHIATIIQQLVGPTHRVTAGQIALRFPGTLCTDKTSFRPVPHWNQAYHLDGLTDPSEKWSKKGSIGNFTMLVGVVLQDIPAEFHGNLVVYPGSHTAFEKYFKKNPNALRDIEENGEKSLPPVSMFAPARQVIARAGDVTLCSYLLGHSVAPNSSPLTRYVVYFRVHALSHPPGSYRRELMTDPWIDCRFSLPDPRSSTETVRSKNKLGQNYSDILSEGSDSASVSSVSISTSMDHIFATRLPTEDELREVEDSFRKAEELFEKREFEEARKYYCRVAKFRKDDWLVQFKTGLCFVFAPPMDPLELGLGEKYGERAIELRPYFAANHEIPARVRYHLKKYRHAFEAVEDMFDKEEPDLENSWSLDVIFDCIKCGAECLQLLEEYDKIESFLKKAENKFPSIGTKKMKQLHVYLKVATLAKLGEKVMANEPKDWENGKRIFTEICSLQPNVFWYQWQAGVCHTYSGNPRDYYIGEKYLRKSIELEPNNFLGYAILVRNLYLQKRYAEVFPVMETILKLQVPEMHVDILLEAIRTCRDAVHQKVRPVSEFTTILNKCKQRFPFAREKLEIIERDQGCIIS